MRIRTVKPEFFSSQSNGRLSREARLLFIGLFNLCDDDGRSIGAPEFIAGAIFPYDSDGRESVERSLPELEKAGKIVRYEVKGAQFIEIPTFHEHQVITRPSAPKYPNKKGVIPRKSRACKKTQKAKKPQQPLNEGSLSPHRAIHSGREGKGIGKEGIEGRDTATQSDVPDKQQAVAQTAVAGVDAEFAGKVFDYWADRGGKDASGFTIPWLKYVKRRWENERGEWVDGTHQWRRGKNGNGQEPGKKGWTGI